MQLPSFMQASEDLTHAGARCCDAHANWQFPQQSCTREGWLGASPMQPGPSDAHLTEAAMSEAVTREICTGRSVAAALAWPGTGSVAAPKSSRFIISTARHMSGSDTATCTEHARQQSAVALPPAAAQTVAKVGSPRGGWQCS